MSAEEKVFEKYHERIVHRHCALVWFLRPMTIAMWPYLPTYIVQQKSTRGQFSVACGITFKIISLMTFENICILCLVVIAKTL